MISFTEKNEKDFNIAENNVLADLYVASEEQWGIKKAVMDLKNDINSVTGMTPNVSVVIENLSEKTIFVGTIGKSPVIDTLINEGKLDVSEINKKWESFIIQVIDSPLPGIKKGLFIVGSDKRGTIFGVYELSRKLGVSPWYWWADVPIKKHKRIYAKCGKYIYGEPSVKYRGIFLNDEAPSLTTWVENTFGGFNHLFYEKVFELLLRLKANFLWPAMWQPRVFNEEDPLNPVLADKYGIVMGTSHHEPMMRSWTEWGKVGKGEWNYRINRDNIYYFWEDGLKRVKDYEGIITLGMRGDGDEAMADEGSFEEKKELLEKIIQDQREIISRLYNKELNSIPQVLALYKEVQTFYEKGLSIPEDITLLLADDNFGNIRMLPTKEDRNHLGGYGIYYHFDYVGAPKSYQWINTIPLPKIWEQMRMVYDYGVDRIWIVNVGDLKPMELPIDFFLEMALDINKWNAYNIREFTENWVDEQFGDKYRDEIVDILLKYTKYNGRRKPELVDENTFSLINYREAERVLRDFNLIVKKAERIYENIEIEKRDAFFQLVLYPTRASRNIVKMYVCSAKNKFYAEQGRVMTNDYAELTERVFEEEAADTAYYNKRLSGGKWDGMMLQPHIGRSNWRGPVENIIPELKRIKIKKGSEMGVYIEGADSPLSNKNNTGILPLFSKYCPKNYYFEVFNRKSEPFSYQIICQEPWINLSRRKGVVGQEERILVSIDWGTVPQGEDIRGSISIKGAGMEYKLFVKVFNPTYPDIEELEEMTFVESNGYISIEVEHYYKKKVVKGVGWGKIPDYGRTFSSVYIEPTTADSITDPENAPYLEYRVYIFTPGKVRLTLYTAPGLNINCNRGLRYSASFDDEKPIVVDTFPEEYDAHHACKYWAEGVMENVHKTDSFHQIDRAGYHTLRIGMIDPGIVIQKILIDMGGVKPSYLGPPESLYKKGEE